MTAPCESHVAAADAGLAIAAAAGDRAAFAAIYDRYADRLYDFCVGMLRDLDVAADCIQSVFFTAATRIQQLDEPEKLRSWLYAITRDEALRRIRETPAAQRAEQRAPAPVPDTLAARTEPANLIAEATGQLPAQDRAVLHLAYRHGLAGPELADALGVSNTTAIELVHRLSEIIERHQARD